MNQIIRHIQFLLVSNDCVIVPGLGAIIAHYMPARYDETKALITPPARAFSFNPGLDHNDGLLVASYARAKSLSYDAALRIVTAEIDDMRRRLASDGRLVLDHIGCLTLDSEGRMAFDTSGSRALSPAFAFLPEMRLRSVETLLRQRELAEAAQTSLTSAGKSRKYFGYIARIAASIAVMIGLTIILTTPLGLDDAQKASFGIDSFKSAKPSVQTESMFTNHGESSSALVLVINRHPDAVETVDTAAHNSYIRSRIVSKNNLSAIDVNPENVIGKSAGTGNSGPYCLVVASLASQNEADRYLASKNDPSLRVLKSGGRYRIYAATAPDSESAGKTASLLSDKYPGVWVCRK